MPSLPNTGDTNWGATLNAWLLASHNSDGSIKNNAGANGITNITALTQVAYDAIGTKDDQTLYIITS